MGIRVIKMVGVVAACGALVLAACGDDSSKSAATTAAPATGTAGGTATTVAGGASAPAGGGASNQAFKVMITGDFTSTIAYTVPETVPAAEGVLMADPNIQFVTCDTKGDPNAATACERKAVDAGVAAVVNTFGAIAQDSSILQKAGIPVLGEADEKADTSFAIGSGIGVYTGIGVSLGSAGCKKMGVLELTGTSQLADAIAKGMKSTGGTEVARSEVEATAPDLAPAIAKLLGAGAECIALSVTPPQLIQAATAVNQTGKHPMLGGPAAIYFPQVIKALGPLAEGMIITDNVASAVQDTPATQAVKADMAKVDAKAALTSQAEYAWLAGKMILAALPNIQGDVTPASMLAALNTIKDLDVMGVAHPLTVENLTNPTLKRFIGHYTASFVIKNGIPTQNGDFVDIGPVIDGP